jgi:hypothetical protein
MQNLFLAISISCLVLFWFAIRHKLSIRVYIIWSLLISLAALSELFIQFPPSFALTLLVTVITIVYCSKLLANTKINMYLLLAIHILRIPIEFILYSLFKTKMLPREMTFIGYNYDIIFGITALVFLIMGIFFRKIFYFQIFRLWNIFGICSVLIVVILGILSSPIPIQLIAYNQPNIAILQFPYALLPNLVVPLVILSHILLLRNSVTSTFR